MSPSEGTRNLVVDTDTPGTEIFVGDATGRVVERGICKLETELLVGLYKIRYQIGHRVTDALIELPPGQGAFYAPIPELPILSAAPPLLSTSAQAEQATQFAQALIGGPRIRRGAGASLFVFVSADLQPDSRPPPRLPGAGLTIHQFSGALVADLADADSAFGCSGSNFELDPGYYLLRAEVDTGPAVEQTIVVVPGWQTRAYIRLTERMPPTSRSSAQTAQNLRTWGFDLPQTGILMARDNPWASPGSDDIRWTAAARQALAAGRGNAAPNREMMRALLQGKFENPMLGIYAGHLLALQPEPNRELLRQVYSNLSGLVGPHPDVQALLIALGDPRAKELTYPEPPMLRASWSWILRACTAERELRPERSYSARMSASLWGSGAWLSWRMPPPETESVQPSPATLQGLLKETVEGRLGAPLAALLKGQRDISPVEHVLVSHLAAASERLQLAKELTAEQDNDNSLRQTREKVAVDLTAENISSLSGIPYLALLKAAATLEQKLGTTTTP